MSQRTRKRFDYTTVLLLLVIAAMFIVMFVQSGTSPEVTLDEARKAGDFQYSNAEPFCKLLGIDEGYTGDCLILEFRHTMWDKTYTIKEIAENVLVGSNVRHIRMERFPYNIHPNAFAGVENVIVYTDEYVHESLEWAKLVTIRPLADFDKVVESNSKFSLKFTPEQFVDFIRSWAKEEKVMFGTMIPLAIAMLVLTALRQKSGRANPLWPVFRTGLGKTLFVLYAFVIGIFTALVLFCEEVDMGMNVYDVVDFLLGWPLIVLIVCGGLFFVWDLIQKDFPWFIARWTLRFLIVMLIVMFCAFAGWMAARIVTENLAMFRALYAIGLILLFCIFVGGGNATQSAVKSKMNSYSAISEDGSSMRVDYYSHGTYVGGDQIVGFGADTMTGASGKIYKKY